MFPSVFHVKQAIESFGVWYALHTYGPRFWTIWVATRMLARERKALGAHTDHYYRSR